MTNKALVAQVRVSYAKVAEYERRGEVHVVAACLGHADPAITLRVYAHVTRSAEAAAADNDVNQRSARRVPLMRPGACAPGCDR